MSPDGQIFLQKYCEHFVYNCNEKDGRVAQWLKHPLAINGRSNRVGSVSNIGQLRYPIWPVRLSEETLKVIGPS